MSSVNNKSLKHLSGVWQQAAIASIEDREWDAAGYMLGHSLECALKSAICKTLHLSNYPNAAKSDETKFFESHSFDRLVLLAGLSDLFNATEKTYWQIWSDATTILGRGRRWIDLKYSVGELKDNEVKSLYKCLYNTEEGSEGIIIIIDKEQRW